MGRCVCSGVRMLYYHKPYRCGQIGPRCFHNRLFTHLTADTEAELVAFALKVLKMKRSWLQHPGTWRVHFDVTGNRLRVLLASDKACEVPMKEWASLQRGKQHRAVHG